MAASSAYLLGDGLVHRMDPVARLACALLILVACSCAPGAAFLAAVLIGELVLAAHVRALRLAGCFIAVLAAPSVVLAAIMLIITPLGAPLAALPWGYIGTGSILAALAAALRPAACLLPLFLSLYLTRPDDLADAVCKTLRVPYRQAFAFACAVRFIPDLANCMSQKLEAHAMRGRSGIIARAGFALRSIPLAFRETARTMREAMLAAEMRGSRLRPRGSSPDDSTIEPADAACMAACALLVAAALVLRALFA